MQKYIAFDLYNRKANGALETARKSSDGTSVYLASDVDELRLELHNKSGDQLSRIAALEAALRYWMPDETMVPSEHQKAWDEHIKLMERKS